MAAAAAGVDRASVGTASATVRRVMEQLCAGRVSPAAAAAAAAAEGRHYYS